MTNRRGLMIAAILDQRHFPGTATSKDRDLQLGFSTLVEETATIVIVTKAAAATTEGITQGGATTTTTMADKAAEAVVMGKGGTITAITVVEIFQIRETISMAAMPVVEEGTLPVTVQTIVTVHIMLNISINSNRNKLHQIISAGLSLLKQLNKLYLIIMAERLLLRPTISILMGKTILMMTISTPNFLPLLKLQHKSQIFLLLSI